MENKFEELLVELYGVNDDFYRISDSIKQIDGHQAMLLDELCAQIELDDASKILRLLWAISLSPSPTFSPTLCALLESGKGSLYIEAVVDAMHDVADEASVPCLRTALEREERWDQDFAFNRKILWALERIGTPDAMEAVRSALESEHVRIRGTAEEILERHAGAT